MFEKRNKLLSVLFVVIFASLACGRFEFGIEPIIPTKTPPAPGELGLTPSSNAFSPTKTPPAPGEIVPTRSPDTLTPTRTPYVPQKDANGLNPNGPWLVFITGKTGESGSENSLWATNPDGSGLTLLTEDFFIKGIRGVTYHGPLISPNGGQIAYLTVSGDPLIPELHIISLPSGEDKTITPLFWPPTLKDYLATVNVILYTARSLAWSPDGQQLAFLAALDGDTSDLYLYNVDDGSITRLSDGPGQAYMPVWSQDGQWILHTATDKFHQGEGYSPFFFSIDGLWAARTDGTEVVEISGTAGEEAKFIKYTPWYGSKFLFTGLGAPCGGQHDCWLDVSTRESSGFPFMLVEYAIDPSSGDLLTASFTTPAQAETAGTYLYTPSLPDGIRVTDELNHLQWLDGAELFSGKSETQPFLQAVQLSEAGVEKTIDWPASPYDMYLSASPDGRGYAWYRFVDQSDETGLWLGFAGSDGLSRLFTGEVRDVLWSLDSGGFFFTSDKHNSAPTEYVQGVYYTSIYGEAVRLIKDISPDEYVELLGWINR